MTRMKLNNGFTVQDSVKKRKLHPPEVCPPQIWALPSSKANRYQTVAGEKAPLNSLKGLQSLILPPQKAQAGDQLARENETHDACNATHRQIETCASHQEPANGPLIQSSTRKRKLDIILDSVSGGRPSERYAGGLENEKRREIASGKALAVQPAFLMPEETKRVHMLRNKTRKKYLLEALMRDRSNSPEFEKINKYTQVQTQHILGRALGSNAAENSGSSVSSSESWAAHDLTSFDEHSLCKALVGMNDGNAESCSLYTNGKGDRVASVEKQANEIHKLESLAYRSVLNALHARGPLDWQQETLLTDLRLFLHISNDEHRFELTHMCSAQDV